MKNKRGQIIFVGMMLTLAIIILALAFAPATKTFIDDARNSSNMDCDNSSISKFDQGACVVSDVTMFYFIGGLLFIAAALIVVRKL